MEKKKSFVKMGKAAVRDRKQSLAYENWLNKNKI